VVAASKAARPRASASARTVAGVSGSLGIMSASLEFRLQLDTG
jgi:hypothetical protein